MALDATLPHHTIVKTGDQSNTLLDSATGETFHSRAGAVREARQVYLEQSGLARRFDPGRPVKVLEVGFGVGLNFFLSAAAAEKAAAPLVYAALEKDLLPADVIGSMDYASKARCGIVEAFLQWRRTWRGGHVSLFQWGLVKLRLLHGDARRTLLGRESYDMVYQDPFSPDKNPELWETIFLGKLYDSLAPGGCLTSYCSKSEIQKRLAAVGFRVEKCPGVGSKRETIRAVKPA